mmetsp:Transcript_8588/g.11961  ORF Transcript_8588/g.11961 Transcript_8588/m.11961 type:complete len:217 (-) Transcript_8588:316-966(-)
MTFNLTSSYDNLKRIIPDSTSPISSRTQFLKVSPFQVKQSDSFPSITVTARAPGNEIVDSSLRAKVEPKAGIMLNFRHSLVNISLAAGLQSSRFTLLLLLVVRRAGADMKCFTEGLTAMRALSASTFSKKSMALCITVFDSFGSHSPLKRKDRTVSSANCKGTETSTIASLGSKPTTSLCIILWTRQMSRYSSKPPYRMIRSNAAITSFHPVLLGK